MRYPSVKTLMERLALDKDKARQIRGLMDGSVKTRDYESVRAWERQCYNVPRRLDRALCAINEILQGFGVEAIQDSRRGCFGADKFVADYINQGDTYDVTVIYDHRRESWWVTSWGDWLESYERRFGRIPD